MKKQFIEHRKLKGITESYKPAKGTAGPVIGSFKAEGIVGENVVSNNGTYYETKLWEQSTAFGKGGKFFDENGKLKPATLLGSLDHPVGQAEMRFENSAIAWTDIYKDSNGIWCGKADILNTPAGRIVKTHLDYAKQTGGGEVFGSSLRGIGDSELATVQNESVNRIIPETFELMALDFVYDPSFSNKATLTESTKSRTILVEQIKKLADEDVEHAKIYKAYAALLTKQPKPLNTEAKAVDNAKALYMKTLKAEQINLANLIYDLESTTLEEFKAKYKNKDYQKVLSHFKQEKQDVDAEINKLENPTAQTESTIGDNMENIENTEQKVVTEATDLDKALEDLGDELDAAEENAEDAEENAEDAEDEVEAAEEDAEEAEDLAEDIEDEVEPTLAEVMNAVQELKGLVEELRAFVQPVEDFEQDLADEDMDLDLELTDDEADVPEEAAEDAAGLDELADISDEDFAEMTDEELLALLED